MNNIYVDELPKKCAECPCMNNDGFGGYDCNLYYKKHKEILSCDYYADTIPTDCPLQPLSVALAEERKKVVQEIGQQLGLIIDGQKQVCCDGDMTGDKTIMAVLDQIERGE